MACSYYCVLRLFFLLAVDFFLIRPCFASSQSPSPLSTSNGPNPTNVTESSVGPSQSSVVDPNPGAVTGTKTGFAVGIVLGVSLLGILAWFIFQCSPCSRNRNKKGTIDLENKRMTAELDGDALVELPAESCGRHLPVPIGRLTTLLEQRSRNIEHQTQESGNSDERNTVTVPESPRQTIGSYRFLRNSSIRVGESAMTPAPSIIGFRIPTPAATSVSNDPELSYLRREIAVVQEQRTRLERLEQLHALRQREEKLQTAIYLREYGGR